MANKRAPIRCFGGNAQPHQPFWTIRDAAGGDVEIEFNGFISEYSWFEDDITPKLFKAELAKLEGRAVTLRINSPGGDVIAASQLRAMLTDYPGKVTARIDGVCASAATMVALAADRVVMQDSAFFMIHDPSYSFFMADLNIADMEQMLDTLKTAKGSLVGLYETRTGLSAERLARMMSAETWMNAADAVKFGFADESISGGQPAKNVAAAALQNFVNVPAVLLNTAPVNVESPDEMRLRDEVQILK
jgi:ATP-dependent Clp protease, protease subunit